MLTRIESALSQWVAPVSTLNGTSVQAREERSASEEKKEQGQSEDEKSSKKPKLVLIEPSASESRKTVQEEMGSTTSYIELVAKIRDQQRTMLRWVGMQVYYMAAFGQKKSLWSHRGSLVNRKVE